jgi:hypothetical protein
MTISQSNALRLGRFTPSNTKVVGTNKTTLMEFLRRFELSALVELSACLNEIIAVPQSTEFTYSHYFLVTARALAWLGVVGAPIVTHLRLLRQRAIRSPFIVITIYNQFNYRRL